MMSTQRLEARVALQVGLIAGLVSACVPLAGVAATWGAMNAKIDRVQEDRKETLQAINLISVRVDQIYTMLGGRTAHGAK